MTDVSRSSSHFTMLHSEKVFANHCISSCDDIFSMGNVSQRHMVLILRDSLRKFLEKPESFSMRSNINIVIVKKFSIESAEATFNCRLIYCK